MNNATLLRTSYFDWLMREYDYVDLDNSVVRIDSPFFDNNFDYIVMYAEFHKDGKKITLTDDGWTLQNLETEGVSFGGNSTSRRRTLQTIIDSLGIQLIDDELTVTTDIEKFPVVKQRLLQAIMQVNDMVVLKDSNVKNIFFEEIEQVLKERKVLFSSRPAYAGKEGITVQFDFSIPTKKQTEKLVRTISNGNDLNRAKTFTMDTQLLKSYKQDALYIVVIDDLNNNFTRENEVRAIFEENTSSSIRLVSKSKIEEGANLILLSNEFVA